MPERGFEPSAPPVAMLTEALATLNQCVWLYQPETGQFLYTSPLLYDWLGLDPVMPELNAERWLEAVHPADREALKQALAELCTDGPAIVSEHRLCPPAGERWVQATIRQYTSESGPVMQAGSLIDISERKAAELRLRSSEQHFASIYHHLSKAMPGAIYQFRMAPDGSFSFPYLSRSAERQWGYTAEMLTNQPEGFLGIVHPEERAAMLASTLASARDLSPWLMKFRAWDKHQQRYRWIRGQTIPARQPDGAILWDGTLLDIDEAEQNLQALDAQRRQLQAILDSIGEGISVLDREGSFVLINTQGQHLLGMGASDAASAHWPELYGVYLPDGVTPCPPDELPSLRALQGEHVRNCELWLHAPSGLRSYLLLTASPLRDEQGEIAGAVSVYRDITALYLAEQQVRQTSDRMKYLLERFNLGFMTLTRDWRISFFNRAAWELSGRIQPSKLLSGDFWQSFPEIDGLGLKFRSEYERAVHEDVSVHFAEYYAPLDTWYETNAYPYQGELDLFFEDVTYARRHQALSELEKELLAYQQHGDGVRLLSEALAGLARIFEYRHFLLLRVSDWGADLPVLLGSPGLPALAASMLPPDPETRIAALSCQRWRAGEADGVFDALLQQAGAEAVRPLAVYDRSGRLQGFLLVLYARGDWDVHAQEADFLAGGVTLLRNVLEAWLAAWRLRESHQRYELAGKATRDVIWDWKLSACELTFTASMQQVFGHSPPAGQFSLDWWYARIHPDEQAQVRESLRLHHAHQEQFWQAEYRFRHADGGWREVLDRGYTLYDDAGQALRMIGAMQDITTIKAHERRIREQNERLLAIAWQQSHEVRRPLANILGLLHLIEVEGPTPEHLGLLRHESEALDLVIQGIVGQSQEALAVAQSPDQAAG